MINTYETIFICPGEISQEKVETALEKVKSLITRSSGTISTAELWGRRRLAFPIKRNREGFYVYLIFSASSEIPAQLSRHYRVTDTILRGLTVKVDPRHLDKIRPALKSAAESAAVPSDAAIIPAQAPQISAPQAQEENGAAALPAKG